MKSEIVVKSGKRGQRGVRWVPPEGTPEFDQWHARVMAGRRKATARRHKAGLRTIPEIAKKYGVSVGFVGRKADRKEIEVIESGSRRYIYESEAERVFGSKQEERGGKTAA
jgi:hypothetical protein